MKGNLFMKLFLEGPGAGYTIHAEDISYVSGKDVKVESVSSTELILTGEFKFKVGTLSAESYYYDTGDISDVDCVASKIVFDIKYIDMTRYYDFEKMLKPSALNRVKQDLYNTYADDYDSVDDVDFEEFDLDDLNISADDFNTKNSEFIDMVQDLTASQDDTFGFVYGGGYIHSTYDGQIMSIEDNDFADMYIDDSTEKGKQTIEYIDKAVQGENVSVNYEVYIDDDYIDSFYNEDDEVAENEAITYAKDYIEHNEVQDVADCYVQRVEWLQLFNGTDYDTDIQDSEIVWNGYDEYELDNDEF